MVDAVSEVTPDGRSALAAVNVLGKICIHETSLTPEVLEPMDGAASLLNRSDKARASCVNMTIRRKPRRKPSEGSYSNKAQDEAQKEAQDEAQEEAQKEA